ncbi:MAG: hypothetical protein J1E34_04355 [Oscillospiraceae bacterium]|nr:hypothetical protein [Oscillospiraceae bacterium]
MEETTAPATPAISGFKPFSYECDYCGETHEGFLGIFVTILHTFLSGVELIKNALTK